MLMMRSWWYDNLLSDNIDHSDDKNKDKDNDDNDKKDDDNEKSDDDNDKKVDDNDKDDDDNGKEKVPEMTKSPSWSDFITGAVSECTLGTSLGTM